MIRRVIRSEVLANIIRHVDCNEVFYREVKNLNKTILENKGNKIAIKAIRMSREVEGDLHQQKAFLRPKISPHGILHAEVEIKHKIEDLIIDFYSERFSTLEILISSKRGVYTGKHLQPIRKLDLIYNKALEILEAKLPINENIESLCQENHYEIWEGFARSQVIKGTKNSKSIERLSRKWKITVLKPNTRNLSEFFKEKTNS